MVKPKRTGLEKYAPQKVLATSEQVIAAVIQDIDENTPGDGTHPTATGNRWRIATILQLPDNVTYMLLCRDTNAGLLLGDLDGGAGDFMPTDLARAANDSRENRERLANG
jgi:hypothetical protein